MYKIEEIELENIIGGASISGALITAIYKAISPILDAGRALGSALRRLSTNNMCTCSK